MMSVRGMGWILGVAMVCGCGGDSGGAASPRRGPAAEKRLFGTTPAGEEVYCYTLTNASGMTAEVMDYGATLVSLTAADRSGRFDDVVLGYADLEGYLHGASYFGATIGRYANRLGGASFVLDGVRHSLIANEGRNQLHGGARGFDKVVWSSAPFTDERGTGVCFRYLSPDGDQGYPGELGVEVAYLLTDENELIIDYRAVTDEPTVVNLTHHSYFNLGGQGADTILDHEMMINADLFVPVSEELIPTGEISRVEGTPMDFREARAIGKRIDADFEQLKRGRGYDHCWILRKHDPREMVLAARVSEPESGRVMEVRTTDLALQFYSGNFLDGSETGKGGASYPHRSAFCLEPEHLPDSPNHPHVASTVLRPGGTYRKTIVYGFSVE